MICVEAEKVPRVDESNLFIDRIVNVPSLGPPDGIGPDIPGIGGIPDPDIGGIGGGIDDDVGSGVSGGGGGG